ncbi:MAG: bacterial Ig-like domain-containing protein, partial [Clostridia bacterium]|nr:bacterial Ig-like domain-containing protein [Clostridia bacterium]
MKRFIISLLALTLLAGTVVLPVSAADKQTETISYTYSAGEGNTYTREMEKLGRGLVAVKTDSGVFLSWRLLDSEDAILGSAKKGVSFKVYRDGSEIATLTNATSYTDENVGTSYSVAPVINGTVGERCAAVSVMPTNYFDIPLVTPETETVDYKYTDSETNELVDGTLTYNFFPADCSTGDLDGDGEYEIIVKWTSAEKDVGSPGSPAYSGTVRFAAYKLDGTKMWSQDINLGKNVFSSAHTAQFLVYDFDGDGKSEMMVQTSRGSKDAKGNYVSKAANPATYPNIASLTDEDNASADYRNAGWGLITTGDEYLTVFNGETGEAMDTIDLPTPRGEAIEWGDANGTAGNRVNRFMASVAYLDGEKPYAVYSRGYYMAKEAYAVNLDRQRTSIAGVSFENGRLNPKYRFDTNSKYPGSYEGSQIYAGNGNHNCAVADVDGDGKDEYMTGALCMEVDEQDRFRPRWCTFLEHGDALHIGDYDPTHKGFEFFTVQEDGGPNHYTGTEIGYGMTVVDADTGEFLFRESASADTGRGVMASIGMGGYYQIWSSKNTNLYMSNGGKDYTAGSKNGLSQNFRVFWDGDLYDELLDGTNITNWNGSGMTGVFNATGCVQINGTKANPSLQADLFGDWREEVVYPLSNGSALRVFTTTAPTNYKMKTLMQDPVYRSGVAAEQTAYNQPPHVGFYLDDTVILGDVKNITVNNQKTTYNAGEEFDKSALTVTAEYDSGVTTEVTGYKVSGYDSLNVAEQTLTISYGGKEATVKVNVTSSFTLDANGYITGYSGANTTETLPVSVNGTKVKGIAAGALASSGITKLYIYDDPVEFAENSLPSGVTLVCFDGSETHNYAIENSIKYELMRPGNYYVNVTYEESEYQNITNIATALTNTTIGSLTYKPGVRTERNGNSSNVSSIKKITDTNGSYLDITSTRFSHSNRHASIIFDRVPDLNDVSEYTMSMDFYISDNSNNYRIELLDESSAVISTLAIGANNLSGNTWYHYELDYNDGVYTQIISNQSGVEVSRTVLPYTDDAVKTISFPVGSQLSADTHIYLDNIIISSPLISNITLNIKDSMGTAVRNASVTMN